MGMYYNKNDRSRRNSDGLILKEKEEEHLCKNGTPNKVGSTETTGENDVKNEVTILKEEIKSMKIRLDNIITGSGNVGSQTIRKSQQ